MCHISAASYEPTLRHVMYSAAAHLWLGKLLAQQWQHTPCSQGSVVCEVVAQHHLDDADATPSSTQQVHAVAVALHLGKVGQLIH